MSDLKHQTIRQLDASKAECEIYMRKLKSNLSGQETRLKWINHYIFLKTPQELTVEEIEYRLGHRLIIKRS